eukprot:jgi/Mesen1/2396/ME000157S01536
MAPLVTCGNCEEGALDWIESGESGPGGYLCENYSKYESDTGCNRLVSAEDYKELLEEAKEARIQSREKSDEELFAIRAEPEGCGGEKRKESNVAALLRGDLVVKRQPLLPSVLSVSEGAAVVRKPYKSPCPGGGPGLSHELLRRLNASKKFVPWKSSGGEPFRPLLQAGPPLADLFGAAAADAEADKPPEAAAAAPEEEQLPAGFEPLVLWQPEDDPVRATEESQPIIVDVKLAKFLRPHQRCCSVTWLGLGWLGLASYFGSGWALFGSAWLGLTRFGSVAWLGLACEALLTRQGSSLDSIQS